jgi:hypothetical protein
MPIKARQECFCFNPHHKSKRSRYNSLRRKCGICSYFFIAFLSAQTNISYALKVAATDATNTCRQRTTPSFSCCPRMHRSNQRRLFNAYQYSQSRQTFHHNSCRSDSCISYIQPVSRLHFRKTSYTSSRYVPFSVKKLHTTTCTHLTRRATSILHPSIRLGSTKMTTATMSIDTLQEDIVNPCRILCISDVHDVNNAILYNHDNLPYGCEVVHICNASTVIYNL